MTTRRFKINIEIPLLVSSIGWHVAGLVHTNFLLYRTCYVDLGYNQSDCAILGIENNNITKYLEPIVQERITVMSSTRSIAESVIPLIICLCVGPWSDKYGRKPILVVSHIGSLISATLSLLFCYFTQLSAWFIVFSNIPSMLLGSGLASSSAMMSYIVDSTPEEYRGFRFALLDIISDLTNVVGNSSSSFIFNAIGYAGVFGIVLFCTFVSTAYIIFFLPESLEQKENGSHTQSTQRKMTQLFKISNIKLMFKIAFEKREKYIRQIILLLLLYSIVGSLSAGEYGLTFLYLRKRFGWTLQKYSLYNSCLAGLSAVGVSSSIYVLHKVLGVTDSQMVMFGKLSALLGSLVFGFANSDVYIYIAGIIRCFHGVTSPMQKSFMSKLISQQDIGKLFSVMMIVGFLFGLGSSPMFNMLYNRTLNTNPGIYNFVGAAFQILSIIIFLIIMVFDNRLLKSRSKHEDKKRYSYCSEKVPQQNKREYENSYTEDQNMTTEELKI